MTEIILTSKDDIRFLELIKQLDEELYEIYGDIQKDYDQHNYVDKLENVALALCDGIAIGCGGYKKFDSESVEIKRVYVMTSHRGLGHAESIMNSLHTKAKDSGYKNCVLETGPEQKAAIRLYKRLGYIPIDNYGPYIGMSASI